MQSYLNIAQIIISLALVGIILLQVRSGSSVGGLFGGGETSVYKTRRGVERTIFNITVGLSIAFFLITLVNVVVTG
jgi:preprotein translocase subunit SecG